MREPARLENLIEGHSQEESRIILKTFYDKQYHSGAYNPKNGKKIWEQLLPKGPKFIRGLDIGCGTGIGLSMARKRGHNIWGVDLANITNRWKENGVIDRCFVASAIDLPFRNNSFDFVMSTDVLEHIPEWDILQALKEMYRVTSRIALAVICLVYEMHIVGNVNCHVTIKSIDWWIDKFNEVGFKNIVYNFNNYHMSCWLHKVG